MVGGSTGLVVGGWWSCLSFSCSVRSLLSCSVSCLVFAVCGGWGCFRLVLFVPWCCLGVWCLHVALAFALVLPWFGDAWCCWGSIGAARLLGGVAWWGCLVLLGATWCYLVLLGCYLGAWGLGLRLRQGWMMRRSTREIDGADLSMSRSVEEWRRGDDEAEGERWMVWTRGAGETSMRGVSARVRCDD